MPSYSGVWTLQAQMQAVAAGTWTGQPQLFAWGSNAQGQLGLGNTANHSSPKQVGALTAWSSIAGGQYFTTAIKTDGTLWSWGYNNNGQLGQNNTTSLSSPVQIGALTTWYQVADGASFTMALKTNGTLWSWGYNNQGQLGLGDAGAYTQRSSPVQIGALTTWYQVVTSNTHTIATKTDGTLWSWGRNNEGQLGLGDSVNRYSPVQVGALTTWYQISAGGSGFTVAIKTDGTLWSWGRNNSGQLGLNDTANRSSPVQVGALTTWSKVANGESHIIAVKTDGTLWSWGQNDAGKLGLGDTVYRSSPVQVGLLTTWLTLSKMPTSGFSLAIKG